jgi:hypothetical protein
MSAISAPGEKEFEESMVNSRYLIIISTLCMVLMLISDSHDTAGKTKLIIT